MSSTPIRRGRIRSVPITVFVRSNTPASKNFWVLLLMAIPIQTQLFSCLNGIQLTLLNLIKIGNSIWRYNPLNKMYMHFWIQSYLHENVIRILNEIHHTTNFWRTTYQWDKHNVMAYPLLSKVFQIKFW